MTYPLQAGDAVRFSFFGSVYTPPPDGNLLQLNLATSGVVIAFPEPPSLVVRVASAWGEGTNQSATSPTGWNDAAEKSTYVTSCHQQAAELPAEDRSLGWDTVPSQEKVTGVGWSKAKEQEAETETRWSATKPTDPSPTLGCWGKAQSTDSLATKALWGQPAIKNLAYATRWFRVDTTSPEWRLNDNRKPPLWNDPPGALAFRFQGVVYHPQSMPPIWFQFGGSISEHPIQPKDSPLGIRWLQVTQHNLSARVPWGEGRYERIRDKIKQIPYSGEKGPETPPEPAENKDCYLLMNTVNVVRLNYGEGDDTPIELLDISIELDIDSFTWQLQATVANRATLAMIEPDAAGTKDIRVTINGWEWVFMVESYSAQRSFNRERYSIRGQSRTRLLSEPYAPLRTKTEASPINAKQAAQVELTDTGFTLTWDTSSTGTTPDWTFPAGVFSYVDQSPMQVIAKVATTAGAVVIPATDTDSFLVQPRYKFSPWAWGEISTPIDHSVPESMVLNMSVEWSPEPAHNVVYVSGTYEGVAVEVTRSSTAGDKPAPDIIEDWLVDVAVNTERGRNFLSGGGPQAVVNMDIPLTNSEQEPGLVLPGELVEVMETPSWVGLCLSTHIKTGSSGSGRVVQTLGLEKHY
ncbi:hypothetical protein M3P05_12420 [Sansalvadorimonas sp. 2012CJ34-2]|uniref:Minor tail protein n=1 Tax=Parendozoicomonas callyspongiae TaxID=2942213 RepID=A0ABT0PH90_9GAMM|nr:hypothetical protein [Sansalvadorimonas sp. 2012CJ34-2]MCL6270729.1 hypothetical protein [Sansalvadorimonas sp. 2012CJ34-2]